MILPIELHPHEVTAILEGRQHQLRRPINPQPFNGWSDSEIEARLLRDGSLEGFDSISQIVNGAWHAGFVDIESVYGRRGDLLWVRETHHMNHNKEVIHYRADYEDDPFKEDECGEDCSLVGEKWLSPITMLRWASRLTLLVKDVRVDRLQDISHLEAIAQGIEQTGLDNVTELAADYLQKGSLAIDRFARLWDSANADRGYGWHANPWVWVIDFMAFPRNVDQVQPGAAA